MIHKLQFKKIAVYLYRHSKHYGFLTLLLFPCLISRKVQPSRSPHHEFSFNTVDLSVYFTALDSACCWGCRSWGCNCTLIRRGSQHYRHLCLLGDLRKKAKWTDVTLKDSSELDFNLTTLKTIVLWRPNLRFDLSYSVQEGCG